MKKIKWVSPEDKTPYVMVQVDTDWQMANQFYHLLDNSKLLFGTSKDFAVFQYFLNKGYTVIYSTEN